MYKSGTGEFGTGETSGLGKAVKFGSGEFGTGVFGSGEFGRGGFGKSQVEQDQLMLHFDFIARL